MGKKIMGCVCDDKTSAPLTDASLMAVDCNGRMLNMNPASQGNGGNFEIDLPGGADYVIVSATGYQPLMINAKLFNQGVNSKVPLTAGTGLPVKLIDSPGGNVSQDGNISTMAWILLGAAVAGYIITEDENGKQKKMGDYGWIFPLGIVALLGGLAYYFFVSTSGKAFWASLFPPNSTTQNNNLTTTTAATASAASLKAQAAAGEVATITQAQAAQIAQTVQNLVQNNFSLTSGTLDQSDQDSVVNQMIQVNNLTDLLLIIQAFGTPSFATAFGSLCSTLGYNCQAMALGPFLNASLDTVHINKINTFLTDTNINYQF